MTAGLPLERRLAPSVRRLVLVLGDQLWLDNPALAGFDPAQDHVLMIEAPGEATGVWSHRARIALFLSAMRHFCNELHAAGLGYTYVRLDDWPDTLTLPERLAHALAALAPRELWLCEAGDWALEQAITRCAAEAGVRLTLHADTHFLCSRAEFARWAGAKKELRLEFFYRDMRRRHGVLMEGREPAGGRWNFDAENREGFGRQGPGAIPPPALFEPDRTTREVLALVAQRFAGHPGALDAFAWPVTRAQALQALERFITERLPHFGPTQDAMWTGLTYGWHAVLSAAMNLHLIHPHEIVGAAEAAWRAGRVPLASAEGFIRQVLGWREFIRGVYWLDMPAMKEANHWGHARALPRWYWTGETGMACMREVVRQTLAHGHAHHIQRLMVTGQFALLAEVAPRAVADWYLAVYVDAVEWVELPNVAGMAIHACGARFTSKPYIASGQYVRQMSNYCDGCRYRPERRSGDDACPMTVLYWAFLDRHEEALTRNPRTALMARNITRLAPAERSALRAQAQALLARIDEV